MSLPKVFDASVSTVAMRRYKGLAPFLSDNVQLRVLARSLWLLGLGLFLLISYPATLAGQSGARSERSKGGGHRITIDEILELRRPSMVEISPDGSQVAYVVTQPQLKANQDHAILYVASAAQAGAARPLAEGIHLTSLAWARDSREIFFVSETKAGTRMLRVQPSGGQTKQLPQIEGRELVQLKQSPDAYKPYQLSPDGTSLLYAVFDVEGGRPAHEARVQGGVVYKGEPFGEVFDLAQYRSFDGVPFELWSYDFRRRQARKVWVTRAFSFARTHPPEFQFSPDGKTLALLYQSGAQAQHSLAVLDLSTGKVTPLVKDLGWSWNVKWSSNGKSLMLLSEGVLEVGKPRYDEAQYTFELATRSLNRRGTDFHSFSDSTAAGQAVEIAAEKQFEAFLHDCSIDARKTRAACIEESPMVPPEVVSVALKGDALEAKPLTLTHLNPEYDAIQLGRVGPLTWAEKRGEFGLPAAGLVLPVNYAPGQRYPLVVMLYNLYNGRHFIADADGFTSYPVQAFAGHGYAVLLLNLPEGTFIYEEGDFEKAKRAEVDILVSAVRSGVDSLVERGIVDSNRMGIMGWSWGAFWTDYIITHYPDWFQAAASGEGGSHNPGSYWQQDEILREQERRFYGGGPYGKYEPRWKEIAPLWNVDHLRIPLLMQYSSAFLNGLELRSAISEQGGQPELVIYPDDEHVFLRPLNRYKSMMRHFDWFNFWLLSEEDPDPTKAEQYARWRELRKLHEESEKRRTHPR